VREEVTRLVDAETIGARLRILRRWRGMTQAEVAGLAGLSPSFVSMVEGGQRPLDRRSHIAAVAAALRVSETDLVGGPHLSADRLQADPHMAIPPLRVALQTNTLTVPAVEQARPLDELLRVLRDEIGPLFSACDYVRLGDHLPDVIDELHFHAAVPADEQAQCCALQGLVEACAYAAFRAKDLGYADLAHLAATRAGEAAAVLEDPVAIGKAKYVWLQTVPRAASWDRTLRAAERAAGALAGHVGDDPQGIQVLGQLTLSAALAAAVSQAGDVAAGWLEETGKLAGRVPDDPARGWHSFSATNVGVWRVAIGVERGESGPKVLELASGVDQARLATRMSRLAAFRCDVGRGLAREPRTRAESVRWLRRAEETAPQRIRNSAPARETVAYLLNRATAEAGGRELRGMAARMGLPH
jgi:transcriptional regulator with XRE-family HTH domain